MFLFRLWMRVTPLSLARYPEFLALRPHATAETNVDYAEDEKRSELKFFRWIIFTSARFTNVGALFDTNGGRSPGPYLVSLSLSANLAMPFHGGPTLPQHLNTRHPVTSYFTDMRHRHHHHHRRRHRHYLLSLWFNNYTRYRASTSTRWHFAFGAMLS